MLTLAMIVLELLLSLGIAIAQQGVTEHREEDSGAVLRCLSRHPNYPRTRPLSSRSATKFLVT